MIYLGRQSVIKPSIFELLAVCGCVSKRVLTMLPYSYVKTNDNLRQMHKDRLIRMSGHGANKHYALLDAGKNTLTSSDSIRYPRRLFANNNTLLRDPSRTIAIGDTAAMLSMARYSIHPNDKPNLPAHTTLPCDDNSWFDIYKTGGIVSPMNCYYMAAEVKRYLRNSNDKGIRYSRTCGILFTPEYLLRVFHSRDVAFEFRGTGEKKLNSLIAKLFSGYVPKQRNALLVFGKGFLAAEKILDGDFDEARQRIAEISKKVTINTQNLGRPLYYRPIMPESMGLLQLMRYPGWEESLFEYVAKQIYFSYNRRTDAFYATGEDGSLLFIGIELNLTKFARMIRILRERPNRTVNFICLDWQEDFYDFMLERYAGGEHGVNILTVEGNMVKRLNEQFEEYWGGEL